MTPSEEYRNEAPDEAWDPHPGRTFTNDAVAVIVLVTSLLFYVVGAAVGMTYERRKWTTEPVLPDHCKPETIDPLH